jgi:hypothetical protein
MQEADLRALIAVDSSDQLEVSRDRVEVLETC